VFVAIDHSQAALPGSKFGQIVVSLTEGYETLTSVDDPILTIRELPCGTDSVTI
jgi:hypothetical protein